MLLCILFCECQLALPVAGLFVMSTAPRSFLRRSSCCCCFLLWASAWWTGGQLRDGWKDRKKEADNTRTHSPAVCGVCRTRVDSPWGRRKKCSVYHKSLPVWGGHLHEIDLVSNSEPSTLIFINRHINQHAIRVGAVCRATDFLYLMYRGCMNA